MTFTQTVNAIWYLICAAAVALSTIPANVLPQLSSLLPEKYKPWIAIAASVLMWLKGHRNLFVNPDGTPARLPYIPDDNDDNTSVKKSAAKAGV